MIVYSDDAFESIQRIYDDPILSVLADRLDDALEEFETHPGAARFRRHRMQHDPAIFWFSVSGSGEIVTILWEPNNERDGFVHYVGSGLSR